MGLAKIFDREPRPEPPAHGARLRRHLLLASSRPRDAARGNDVRARPGGPTGQGALRGHLLVLTRGNATRCVDPRPARNALSDPSAVVLDVESMGRRRIARYARRARNRLHRLFAARARHAHRQVFEGHPRWLARDEERITLTELPLG